MIFLLRFPKSGILTIITFLILLPGIRAFAQNQEQFDKKYKEGTNAIFIAGTQNDLFFLGHSNSESFIGLYP